MNTQPFLSIPSVIEGISDLPPDSQHEKLAGYGVEFDQNGQPLWYTVPEWFDELDRKLIGHFGEEYRELANKRRIRWNSHGTWRFSKL